MVSVNSYLSAASMGARALGDIDRAMAVSQKRIATGLRVSSSIDDPTAYAAASSLRSEIASHEISRESLGRAAAVATIAAGAAKAAGDLMALLSAEVSSAVGKDSAGKAQSQERISLLQGQLRSVVAAATYDGSNLLDGTSSTTQAGGLSFDVSGMALTNSAGTGILQKGGTLRPGTSVMTLDVSTMSDADLAAISTDLSSVSGQISAVAGRVAGMDAAFDGHSDFLGKLVDIKSRAEDALVGVDEDEEAARILALARHREYVVDMMVVAKESARGILQLFQ